jgi:DNA-binding NtrC family response regulator
MAKVLLVDDDPDLLDAVALFLRREHQVRVAGGFPEAIAALIEGPLPDVVITDYDMAPYCGDDLLAVVAVRFPSVWRILYTGTPRASMDGAGATAHHVLDKGGDPNELVALVRDCLRRHSA